MQLMGKYKIFDSQFICSLLHKKEDKLQLRTLCKFISIRLRKLATKQQNSKNKHAIEVLDTVDRRVDAISRSVLRRAESRTDLVSTRQSKRFYASCMNVKCPGSKVNLLLHCFERPIQWTQKMSRMNTVLRDGMPEPDKSCLCICVRVLCL